VTEGYNAVICLTRMVNTGTCTGCYGIKKLMHLYINIYVFLTIHKLNRDYFAKQH